MEVTVLVDDIAINDDQGATSNEATVNIIVEPGNSPPQARDDQVTTDEDTQVTIDVLANDDDPDGDRIILDRNGLSEPAHGRIVLGNSLTYIPDPDFHGIDSFTYTISDGNGGTDTATVSLTVTPENDAPVAVNDLVSVTEDAAATIIDVLANDTGIPSDGTLTTTDPTNGTVVINDGGTPDDITDDTITYTPDSGFDNATDTFEYTVCDAMDNCVL